MNKRQNIIITGASSGIGKSIAEVYAGPNVNLGLIARNIDMLNSVAELCKNKGANVIIGSIDVTDSLKLKNWIDEFNSCFPVDLIIANAGITSCLKEGDLPEDLELVNRLIGTNINGVINTIYSIIHSMQERKSGQIAIISSIASFRGLPITPAYCATKSAVKAYGDAIRGWLKRYNIMVSVICPGFVRTNMSDKFPCPKLFMTSPERAAEIIKKGLSKNKPYIIFPYMLSFGLRLLSLMPSSISDWILHILKYDRL